jgi:hypothetical protein
MKTQCTLIDDDVIPFVDLILLGTYCIICSVIEFFSSLVLLLFIRSHTSLNDIFMVFVVRFMYSEVLLHPRTLSFSLFVSSMHLHTMIWLLKFSYEWQSGHDGDMKKINDFALFSLIRSVSFHFYLTQHHTMKTQRSCTQIFMLETKKRFQKCEKKNLLLFQFPPHQLPQRKTWKQKTIIKNRCQKKSIKLWKVPSLDIKTRA